MPKVDQQDEFQHLDEQQTTERPAHAGKAAAAKAKVGYWSKIVLSIVTLRGSAHGIARGVAIGFILALSPTLGLQIIAAILIAPLFRANLPATLTPLLITNIFTAAPVYAFTYWVGSFFWAGPSVTEVRVILNRLFSAAEPEPYVTAAVDSFWQVGQDIIIPMAIGGLLVGGTCAALFYPLTYRAVRSYREKHGLPLNGGPLNDAK